MIRIERFLLQGLLRPGSAGREKGHPMLRFLVSIGLLVLLSACGAPGPGPDRDLMPVSAQTASNTFVEVDLGGENYGQGASAVSEPIVQRDKDQPILSDPDLSPDPARLNGKVEFTVNYLDEQGEAPQGTPQHTEPHHRS